MRMLEGDVEIGQQPVRRVGHQRDQVAHIWVGIDVVQPHPCAELSQFAGEIKDMAAHLAVFPRVCVILAIKPVGAGVLADYKQLAHAAFDQFLRLA